MSANIIFEAPGRTRITQYQPTTTYDIGELNFYVGNRFGNSIQVFVIMKTAQGLYDIIELVRAGSAGNNILYKVPLQQPLRINEEQCDVRIMVVNTSTDTFELSQTVKMYISTTNYTIARQVYVAQEVGKKAKEYYEKIFALTQENLEIYKRLKGDNMK